MIINVKDATDQLRKFKVNSNPGEFQGRTFRNPYKLKRLFNELKRQRIEEVNLRHDESQTVISFNDNNSLYHFNSFK